MKTMYHQWVPRTSNTDGDWVTLPDALSEEYLDKKALIDAADGMLHGVGFRLVHTHRTTYFFDATYANARCYPYPSSEASL